MIRRLRIKFVCINMVIVTIMLCGIFFTVLYFTKTNLERESIGMMQTVALNPMHLGRPGDGGSRIQLPYFVLQIGSGGDLVAAGGGYYDLTDRDFLRELIALSTGTPRQIGELPEYGLRFCRVVTPTAQCIVFADMSSEVNTMNHLVQNCLLIGAVSFLVFLAISILLSGWAIKPVDMAWRQQKQFVADASHELKTPLTVILSNAQLLSEVKTDEALRDHLTENILTVSNQMRGLIENLLDLARVDAERPEISQEPVPLSELVADAILPFEPVFFERDLELERDITPDLHIRGSKEHLKQLTDILLDNAQKYGVSPGRVEISLRRGGKKHCLLAVSSSGDMLSPQELKDIFKRFYRTDAARTRDGSYGLGLSIAAGIVRAHGGTIWAESHNGVNTFFVRLPLVRPI